MQQPDQELFLPHFNEDDESRLRRFDNRAKRYAIPSYLWKVAVNEPSEVKFMRTMKDGDVPRRVPIREVIEPLQMNNVADPDLALLTAEC